MTIKKAIFVKNRFNLVTINNSDEILAKDDKRVQDFVASGGIIQPYIFSKDELINQIDQESSLEIIAKYPDWKQRNLANRIKPSDTDEAFAEMQDFIRDILNKADVRKQEINASVIDKQSEE